jgi:ankyrin repeat protein
MDLITASLRGSIHNVQELLNKNADVNAQDGRYGNALQAAACNGHQEIMTLLLDKNVDVNA